MFDFFGSNKELKNRMKTKILQAEQTAKRHEEVTKSKKAGIYTYNSILADDYIRISKEL
jgi:chromosome condensin MukBEF ATPase and DNA-binding subunit MukB